MINTSKKQEPFWATASMVIKLTGWNKKDLQRLRRINPSWYKINKGGGYSYNVNAIPKTFLKENANLND